MKDFYRELEKAVLLTTVALGLIILIAGKAMQ